MLQDLGTLDGAVLVFGGPYSNIDALQALMSEAEAAGIGSGHMVCTGDTVAYCAAPRESVALLRDKNICVVAGNCEKQLAAGADTCGCGFDAGSACDLLSGSWYSFAASQISVSDRDWMRNCPDIAVFRHQGARYAVIHGGVTDIARFIWHDSDETVFADEWAALEDITGPVDHVIAGHCGIPFIRTVSHGRWINAGVIGMPPHDGRQQTRYAVIDGGEVLFHHLSYDTETAAARMEDAGLVQGYHSALRSGYWPSEDVLPSSLRLPSFARG
ncbi:metallophosphoesterase family protein [uncultured Roseobacter sp.]|uniref:metallophosphoesterase family protein n=1 Tax=uncultured Roseobacter sp. TaxID=114847 RepID=UPI0026346F55|nr:metallophosphoesterase family protein [uncultured Roseobacter sp.]